MKRSAIVQWQGTGKEGWGRVTAQSGAIKDAHYAYGTRFENFPGSNPEELIAAAHASCFTMKLAFNFSKAGFKAEDINTKCEIHLDAEKGEITDSHLWIRAKVPGISKEKFAELVDDAAKNCPVSKLLKAKITHEEILEE